jgi:hypothetical protein
MSLQIESWSRLNKRHAARNPLYKSLLQSLQTIRSGSVLRLRTPSAEPWLGQLIKRGQNFSRYKLKVFPGSRKRCHQNASCIWIMDQGVIATGFAYAAASSHSPGSWHRHSWGLDCATSTPRIIETTHKFENYYGVILDNEECKCFVLQNVLPMAKTVIEKINAIAAGDRSKRQWCAAS